MPSGAASTKFAVLLAYGFKVSPYPADRLMAGVVPPEDATGDVPVTEVTVPPPPLAAIVIEPEPLVMVMPEPAVRVDFASVLPVLLPINNWPSVYVV